MRVAISALPNTLDWNRSSETSFVNYPVLQAMMRSLTRLDERHQPQPDLAESWVVSLAPGPSPQQTFVFHLRPGLVWSDGQTPHLAQDYVFAWKRALAHGLETAELADLLGAKEVIAAREARDPARLERALGAVGVEALGPLTLRVTLGSPRSYFLSRLATVYPFFPAPSRLLEGRSEDEVHRYFEQPTREAPVVLGTYRLASWDRSVEGSPLRLELNPFGPGAGDATRAQAITLLQSSLGPLLYQRCEVDFLFMDDPAALRGATGVLRQPLLSVFWLGLNTGKVPLKLRQAISHAVDRERVMAGLMPAARPAFGLLPDELPGAVSSMDPEGRDFPRYDAALARRLVAESGYDGRPLRLLVRSSGTFLPEVAMADAVRRDLQAVGVKVRLVTTADFSNDAREPGGATRPELFLRRIGADYAHPQTFFTPFLPSGINYTDWQRLDGGQPAFDFQALVEQAAAEPDFKRARALFTRAQRMLLVESAVAVPLVYPDRYYRRRRWLNGLGVDPFNFITLRDARLEERR